MPPPDNRLVRARRERRGIVQRLVDESYAFNFFQAVHLITRLFPESPEPGETTGFFDEPVRLRPSSALVFPASDVKDIDIVRRDDGTSLVYVTSTFMGLYGVDASLPSHFHDVIAYDREESDPLREFLDIFNHRLYAFYYRSWKKYRPSLCRASGCRETPRDTQRFLSLAGLGTIPDLSNAPVEAMRLASFAGRLLPRTRNAEGLAALLTTLLDGIPAEVEENVPRWIPIETRPTMGSSDGIALGVSSNIGEQVYDRSSKFRVKLGPVDLDTYLALLPGGDLAERVAWLIRLYAPDHLQYDVELTLNAGDVDDLELGSGSRLGLSTFLGNTAPSMQRVVNYDASGGRPATRARRRADAPPAAGLSGTPSVELGQH